MFFSKTSVLIALACLASTANADCGTDVTSTEFSTFYAGLTNDYDYTKFPQECVDVGGDIFTYSGTTTCSGAVTQIDREIFCAPVSCTASDGIASLPFVLAAGAGAGCTGDYTYEGLGNDGTPASVQCRLLDMKELGAGAGCTGDYTYEGLGNGTPASVQCRLLDMNRIEDAANFVEFVTARIAGEANAGDYSALPPLCDAMKDAHYFTFSGTQTCTDGTSDLTDVPMCLPESCTDGDEATLAEMVAIVEKDIYDSISKSCTVTGLTFDGLDDHDTSGAFFPAATSVVTAGMATIVAGLAAAI
eukprot:CAMPEP_0194095150 /NCGR_PEP_ID=MMETSP0149-20130528/56677_1 /TAXON_ID=122233 /ORGANISM="Chaetoceros debilis, Strain MM31A-1" /LENGTH=302 /DNA_ID=CAMNT_0038781087 /DNA_START=342 /DNA_END=1251 /DNA_ORIENTATION=-